MPVRRFSMVAVIVAFAFVAGCEAPPTPGKRVGDSCPEIAGQNVDGNVLRLSDYRGKVVLVSFWGTWCPPCRAMLPHEREMVQGKYRDKPFVLLGVAKDSAETLKEFAKANPLPWPNIVDGSGVLAREWNLEYFPSAVLVDHNGVIRKLWMDSVSPDEVWSEVAKAVAAAERQ